MKKKTIELIESYRGFTETAYAPFKGLQRVGVCFCNILLSAYIAAVVILHNYVDATPKVGITILCGLLLFFIVYQAFKLLIIKYGEVSISRSAERVKLSWKVFSVCAIIVFSINIVNLFAHYPGGISADIIVQWKQNLSGEFVSWHPVIHTMIIGLVTHIVPVYSFFVGFQIACFSVASGYMAATLAAWGIKKGWFIAFLIVVVSISSTRDALLFAWKDTALTILLLCLAVYMVNIVLSDGKWLCKWYNVGAIAIVGALASLVRHNGFFFTIPLGILVIILYRKVTRNAIIAVAASILTVLFITEGVYTLAKVKDVPSQTYVESVGLPMTIMGGVMVNNPEALDPQTKEFLNRIADDETWKNTFFSGNYNTIKFATSASDVIEETPPREFLNMTLQTIRNAPIESLLEVIALTRMVWDPLQWDYGISFFIDEASRGIVFSDHEIEAMQPIQERSQALYYYINAGLGLLTPGRILASIGLNMLLLLFAGVYSVNRNLGAKALFLFLPSAAYNFGTMLLLCGPDYRFFHFNIVITLPLIIALLAKYKSDAAVQQDTSPQKCVDAPADTR